MNRRELVKKGAVGFCGLSMPLSDKEEAVSAPLTNEGMGCVGFPDKIVSSFQYQDKIIVACEHSVWEMWPDHTGLFVKSLISQF